MKIFAAVFNYAGHNKISAGALYNNGEPVVCTKVDSALLKPGRPFFVPDHLGSIYRQAHLVVRVCRLGKSIPVRFAHRYYDAVTVGVDFTAHDLQQQASAAGLPWDLAKGFDGAAAIGEWVPVDGSLDSPEATALRFRLDCNGQTVQSAAAGDMRHSADELLSYVSQYFTLKTGDLIYTGTPPGEGPVSVGDLLEGWIDDRKVLNLKCR